MPTLKLNRSLFYAAMAGFLCMSASFAAEEAEKPGATTRPATTAQDPLPSISPTEAYLSYHAKVHAQSLDLTKLMASKPKVPPKGDAGSMMEAMFAKQMSPQKLKITSEKIDGKRATLTALGLSPVAGGGAGAAGTIVMGLENGEWKLLSETWGGKAGGGQFTMSHGSEVPLKGAPTTPTQIWCDGAAAAAFPQKSAYGLLRGQPFAISRAVYDTFMGKLDLRQGNDNFFPDQEVSITTFDNASPAGKSFIVSSKSDDFKDPHVSIMWKKQEKTSSASYTGRERYGMRLQFSPMAKNGMIPGYIVLRLPDKSYVEGYFYATLKGK